MSVKTPKDVFNILEGPDGKSKWTRVGHAFLNKDGSINVLLEKFPREGKLQIRERRRSGAGKNNN